MSDPGSIEIQTRQLADVLLLKRQRLAVAESCTGGWLAKVCTDLAGSSQWFECGFVTYSNASKRAMLGVSENVLGEHGAVSLEVVAEMAQGALQNSEAHWSVAISGIAGPGGGSAEKPVGTVCFGWANRGGLTVVSRELFSGGRESVRKQSIVIVIDKLIKMVAG
ncbi:MAG: nicotinamide-nucleotide amidohydrolase family protein [Gammaproteobacteria bacterium]